MVGSVSVVVDDGCGGLVGVGPAMESEVKGL